ncbi:MAG: SfnB family sulfur acquisition oxidoreductase [Alphaproteobacteria bacterium]|nr:SfnB family sulfur acquisition oxidoreductase [Alphaproteobacteria bacterium]
MDDRSTPARLIRTEAEALAVAAEFRASLAEGAAERDRHRRLPLAEVAALSQSGLWAITVPREHGGADVGYAALAEVVARLAEGDSSVAQIPQNHFSTLETLRHIAPAPVQREFFARVLAGARFGNAEAERGPPAMLRPAETGFRLDGRKAYCTGALFAHFVTVTARDAEGRAVVAIVERDAPGLTLLDDWSGMGQRTTASGTAILDALAVPAARVLPLWQASARRTTIGALAQLLHAAIDLGIARAALAETARFVHERSRPFADAGVPRAADDPLLVVRFGQVQTRVHAAEAMLARAAASLDAARNAADETACSAASIAVAEAKVLTTEAALAAADALFELAGTHATLACYNLDRYWRDARTHTLHDPIRWKHHAIGDWHLNGAAPPIRSYL